MSLTTNSAFPVADRQTTVRALLADVELDPAVGLVTQIYQLLWGLIVTIKLLPGQLVSEKEISESLKASKTPVREALIRLEDAGLVTVVPKSGTYVTPIRINRYIEACFTRLQLEIGAVRRAASRNHDVRRLSVMDDIMQQQAASVDSENHELFFQLDEQLHEAFFVMAGVPGVWDVVKRTQSEVYRIRYLKRSFQLNKKSKVLADHQAIVDAIHQGDEDQAQTALTAHIGSLEGELQELSAIPELLEFIEITATSGPRSRSVQPW